LAARRHRASVAGGRSRGRGLEVGNEGLDLAASLGHLGCEPIEAVPAASDSEDSIPSSYQLFDEDVPQSS
jgi:hypothetical protein